MEELLKLIDWDKEFVPNINYNPATDSIELFTEEDLIIEEPINDHITLYISYKNIDNIIGCEILSLKSINASNEFNINNKGDRKFKPYLFYNKSGDQIELHLANEGVVGDRVNEWITLYRSIIDDRVIGLSIKSVSLLERPNDFLSDIKGWDDS